MSMVAAISAHADHLGWQLLSMAVSAPKAVACLARNSGLGHEVVERKLDSQRYPTLQS